MFDITSLYQPIKDIISLFRYKEGELIVDFNWPEKSGVKSKLESEGYKIRYERQENIQSRILDGYEIYYHIDKVKRTKNIIRLKDGLTLIMKKTKN